MTSKAREKIDPNIRDMFDAEVDRPEHDKLLLTLFNDEKALRAILSDLHGAKPLPEFTTDHVFDHDQDPFRSERVSYDEAVRLTGIKPSWSDPSPIRIELKRLEVPLEYSTDSRYSRIIGFADLVVAYKIMGWPRLGEGAKGSVCWSPSYTEHCALFEVKSAWPTLGNLVRQLQLYRNAYPIGFRDRSRSNIVVGPDAGTNDVLCEHHYRLVTFDKAGASFCLTPDTAPKAKDAVPGRF